MELHLQRIAKHYTGVAALDGIDLDIGSGELVALLGPSGSGKTTLLRVVAGLLAPDTGRVLFGDSDATRLSLRDRNVGFVFQHYALFRHMTVAENIAFGLRSRPRARRPDKAGIARRVDELLQLIQLPEHGGHLGAVVHLAQPAAQVAAHLGVQRPERLVEQEEGRTGRQRARDRDALPHPA